MFSPRLAVPAMVKQKIINSRISFPHHPGKKQVGEATGFGIPGYARVSSLLNSNAGVSGRRGYNS
jgi:hypothetical protein